MTTTVSWSGSTEPGDRSGTAHFVYDLPNGQCYKFDVRLPDFRVMQAIEFWAASRAGDHLVNTRRQLVNLANELGVEIEWIETEHKVPNA
jgi:hypothetical protein